MSVNFFNTICIEESRREKLFGICDDQNTSKAYTDNTDNTKWIAKVTNIKEIDITFTAIDNCIIVFNEDTEEQESSCDGMLTFNDSLFLVELKIQEKNWIPKAKSQLENTIKLISENHDLSNYRFKKAFACNRKHPNFTVIDVAERKSFFKRTGGFRIDIQAEIVIK
ncbi:hypothetical protein ACFOUP_05675 [Belliella kenyensis]|uniref:Uncharacterized protein n=1 Tax=Belliella kenyensis TaxID=1472724 RepID=A0ABV8EHT6_9BACT|nr:hypothetical protein [Belliella kenyensis]MCH7402784.1 hypothetical protein [Belliella kenyensis]MDN3603667.1 hypothetical protein [Belliella kenyensis]